MVNCSSSVSQSRSQRSHAICTGVGRHRRAGDQSRRWYRGNRLFVLPTIAFRLLYCLVILRHGRRLWVAFGVTTNPTAEWTSRQIIEAFPWDSSPRYLIRDRDTAYGVVFRQRLRAMGIREAIAGGIVKRGSVPETSNRGDHSMLQFPPDQQ